MKANDWEALQLDKEMSAADWERLTDTISRITLPEPEGFVEEAVRRYAERYRGTEGGVRINQDDTVLLDHIKAQIYGGGKGMERERKGSGGILDRELNRRTFLKGAAATAAAAGVVVSGGGGLLSPLAEAAGEVAGVSEEKTYAVVCRANCGGVCQMNAHVRDGKLVRMSKRDFVDPRYNRICQRGRSHPLRVYSADRLKYPMRRVGERGAGQWEQISWDEAIQEICTKWKGYQKDFGKESIFFALSTGSYSPDAYSYQERLRNYMGASKYEVSVDAAMMASEPRAFGYGIYLGGNSPTDWINSKNIFIWGCNLTQSNIGLWHFLAEAKKGGTKVICIDPVYNIVASKSDKFVPIRPTTDALLAMAMTQIIIDEGLADEEYLKNYSVAPFLVKDSDGKYLRLSDLGQIAEGQADAIVVRSEGGIVGLPADIADPVLHGSYTINGIKVTTSYDLLIERLRQFPIEEASELCEVPMETIRELALMFTEGPTSIGGGLGPDHYTTGQYTCHSWYTLLMVSGNMGKPGCGLTGAYTLSLVVGANTVPMDFPADHLSMAPIVTSVKMLDVVNTKKYGDIPVTPKSLFVTGVNPAGNICERKSVLEVLDSLDFIVAADMFMSETAALADIVLPVSYWFEMDSMVSFIIQVASISEKAIEPLGESKGDLEILNMLGEAMGFGPEFSISREDYFTGAFDNDYSRSMGLSYERLKKEKQFLTYEGDYIHGAGGVYATETGRAQFYLETVTPTCQYGQELDVSKSNLPYWEPPVESWHGHELAKKYPLIFSSERSRFRVHTQFGEAKWFRELEPEPFVKMNPQDAEERGIKNGDTVKAFNDRGFVVVKAVIHNGIPRGMTVITHGWVKKDFIDGHYSDLSSRATHPDIANNAFFDALCEIQKM